MTHPTPTHGRRARLKAVTRTVHAQLDRRIMAFNPFADRARYAGFLQSQYRLHRDVEFLYRHATLGAMLPGLVQRSRLELLEKDLADLGVVLDEGALPQPAFTGGTPLHVPQALAWLYTVEGSNLGAAFLLKAVAPLGLHGGFGARHLAPHPDGRAAHWRDFIAELDALELPAEQEAAVDAGALYAFAAALTYVDLYCRLPAPVSP
ncbi:MAG: biliverdin-producing heme oxygenase [Pseudorhodoferax sp.]